jgi:hypothetical protein
VRIAAGLMPPAFVDVNATEYVPAAEGVPLIIPLVILSERPGGRFVAANEAGALLAVTIYVNAVPAVALTDVALVMDGTATLLAFRNNRL